MTRTLLITPLPLKADAPDMRLMNLTGVEEPMNNILVKANGSLLIHGVLLVVPASLSCHE